MIQLSLVDPKWGRESTIDANAWRQTEFGNQPIIFPALPASMASTGSPKHAKIHIAILTALHGLVTTRKWDGLVMVPRRLNVAEEPG
jgi:hypothetical protein